MTLNKSVGQAQNVDLAFYKDLGLDLSIEMLICQIPEVGILLKARPANTISRRIISYNFVTLWYCKMML